MPDLPSNAPQMFQLPGPSQITQQPGLMQGLAQGLPQGMNMYAQAAQARAQQQQLAQQKMQIDIEKNMKMLETGSQMMLEGGPQVQNTGMSLIQKSFPFLTGQPLPQGMPLGKEQAKDLSWYMDQHRLFQKTNGAEGLSAQDAVTGATQAMSQYGRKYQEQQMGLLEKTPLYKEATANQESGTVGGQPVSRNAYTGEMATPGGQPASGTFMPGSSGPSLQNEITQSINRSFLESTKDQQQQLSDLIDFTTNMGPRLPPNATPQDKADLVVHQKMGLLKYMQMNVPASRRPPNLASMEDISKEDLVAAHAEQVWKQLFKTGAPLTEEPQEAILKSGVKTGLTAEKTLSDTESSWASRATANQVDPSKTLQNLRPSSIPSTSKFFPNRGASWNTAHVGQIVVGKSGPMIYRGGDRTDPKNWTVVK